MSAELRACQMCGAPVRPTSRLSFCRPCGLAHCGECGKELPRPRAKRGRCGECQRAHQHASWAAPRPCPGCRRPLPAHHLQSYCHVCNAAEQRHRRSGYARRPDPHCIECGAPIAGRANLRCRDCMRRYTHGLPRRLCPWCTVARTLPGRARCRACERLYDRWSYAYDCGDPAARALRTKRAYAKRSKNKRRNALSFEEKESWRNLF